MHRRDAESAEELWIEVDEFAASDESRSKRRHSITSSLLVLLCVLCASAVKSTPAKPPPAEKIGEHRYRIGRVTVDTAARVAEAPARVNLRRGVIEYLAVAADGKLHESVLQVDAEPLHLHLALLLIGLEPGPRPRFQGDPKWRAPRDGAGSSRSAVEARVVWRQGGRERSTRLEEWAWDIPAKRPMPPVAWWFTGAAPPGAAPATAEQRSVVATYTDPDAVLNNPLPTGADDTVYKANERIIPPVGTPVRLVLRPAEKAQHGDTEARRD